MTALIERARAAYDRTTGIVFLAVGIAAGFIGASMLQQQAGKALAAAPLQCDVEVAAADAATTDDTKPVYFVGCGGFF